MHIQRPQEEINKKNYHLGIMGQFSPLYPVF